MPTCPNKNLQEWKTLVSQVGETKAYGVWDEMNNNSSDSPSKNLNTKLKEGFFSDFNFDIQEYDSIKSALNYDNTQMVDLVSKFIAVEKGASLDKSAAYVAYKLLAKKNNKIAGELKFRIYSWSKYNEKFKKYAKEIRLEKGFLEKKGWLNMVREKIIIDYLAETIVEYDKNPVAFEAINDRRWTKEDFNWFKTLIRKIKNYFYNQEDKKKILKNISVGIASEILNNSYDFLDYKLEEDQILKSYQETIQGDDFADSVVKFVQKQGIVLTGSLALRYAGKVYRTVKETLHDLDFVVPYDLSYQEDSFFNKHNSILKDAKAKAKADPTLKIVDTYGPRIIEEFVKESKWFKDFVNKYPSYHYIRGFIGKEHWQDLGSVTMTGVIEGEFYKEDGKHTVALPNNKETQEKHKKGDYIENTGYIIDHFVRTKSGKEEHENYFKLWKEIMIAKLMMGRPKDLVDFKNFIPFTKSKDTFNFYFPEYVYANKDIIVEEAEKGVVNTTNTFNQTNETEQSVASDKLVAKMKLAAKEMGINIESLRDYARDNSDIDINGLNGVADLTKKVIAIAEGKENEAITEEIVHIATAIIEQTHPGIITSMISKIGSYQIYKDTFEAYKNNKNYQLSNGKPDIRKIKKEALDKLIAEVIIHNSKNLNGLTNESNNVIIAWINSVWKQINSLISQLYSKTSEDVLQALEDQNIVNTASNIMEGRVGDASNIKSSGVFEQRQHVPNTAVDMLYDKIDDRNKRLTLFDDIKDPQGNVIDPRHRDYVEDDGTIKRVQFSVTELISKNDKPLVRTPKQQIDDNQKMVFGSDGHDYIQDSIKNNYIDKNGYALEKRGTTLIDKRGLSSDIALQLDGFVSRLMNKYLLESPDARFIIENDVINEKTKGYVASAIDFLVLVPTKNKDGSDGLVADVLDWKFTGVDKNKDIDIPYYKQNKYRAQMKEYANILYNYGLEQEQLRHARMVPLMVTFDLVHPMLPAMGKFASSMEIGDVDSLKETDIYLLPVPLKNESTGIDSVDSLVSGLNSYYETVSSKEVTTLLDKEIKSSKLNLLSVAIRTLQVSLNFEPLIEVGIGFLKATEKTLEKFSNVDFSTLPKDVLDDMLGELLDIQNGANRFIDLDQSLLEVYPNGLSDKQKLTMARLSNISQSVRRSLKPVEDLQKQFTVFKGHKEGVTTEQGAIDEEMLEAELVVGFLAKTFLEASKLSSRIIRLGVNLVMKHKALVEMKFKKSMDKYEKVLVPLELKARAIGKASFDMIGRIDGDSMLLFHKLSSDYLQKLTTAREDKNKKFIINNVDKAALDLEVKKLIKKQTAFWNSDSDPSDSQDIVERRLQRIANFKYQIDINNKKFVGWNSKAFINLINKYKIEKGNYSKDYLEMAKNPEALAMWEQFTEWNKKAEEMGYIKTQGEAYFPLIEATTLQKFAVSKNKITAAKDFFKDLYSANIEEKKSLSRVDPETNQVRKNIPTFFTQKQKNKPIEYMSKDLGMIGALYSKALLEYESNKELENTLLTLYQVEKNKGNLLADEAGRPIPEGKRFKKSKNKDNENAESFKALMEDALYNFVEDTTGISTSFNALANRSTDDSEKAEVRANNLKKALDNSNVLVRSLGVGLKFGIAVANWAGQQFQSFIMSGGSYLFKEYQKNHLKVMTNRLSLKEKGLIDKLVPLSEDIVLMLRRKMAKKYSNISRLNTWSFSDVMQVTNSFPEIALQITNALSFYENTMVLNGKLVNIREHVRALDRRARVNFTIEQRKELQKTFESRVTALKETSSIVDSVVVTEDKTYIPGVSEEEWAKLKIKIEDHSRNLNGQMSAENKAGYRRNILARSFMMFRTWIPKLVSVRTLDISFNTEQQEWEYGRARLWFKTLQKVTFKNIFNMKNLLQGTPEGMKIMDKMLAEKKEAYRLKTGKTLTISKEEWYDLMDRELSRQVKEIRLTMLMLSVVLAAKSQEPPEDSSPYEKNQTKYFIKLLNKISDELLFYYNPFTFQSVSKGNILPSLNLLTSVGKIINHLGREVIGTVANDEEMTDKAKPLKYFFNIIPGLYQYQTDVEPLIFPEYSKEKGVITSTEARR